MPSIEIVCIGQLASIDFNDLPFAVESSAELKSHRIPKPLFQKDSSDLQGCIYHLGNPDLKAQRTGRIFFAYELLSDPARSAPRLKISGIPPGVLRRDPLHAFIPPGILA